MARSSGPKTRNIRKLGKQMQRIFADLSSAEAQFGVHKARTEYIYRNEAKGKLERAGRGNGWNNMQIMFYGLMKKGRNMAFTTSSEREHIVKIWERAVRRAIRGGGSKAALSMGAKLVARQMMLDYRQHMMDGLTSPGRGAVLPLMRSRKSRIARTAAGNVNYRKGNDKDVARRKGYGVDTGQVWDAFYTGTKLSRSGK